MNKYTIVKDTSANEYALLFKEKLKKVFNDTHKVWAEGQKDMGPEHVFWNGGKYVDPNEDITKGLPKKTLDIGIPVVHFYKDKKVYETAMYTCAAAYKRYEIIKDVKTEDQFFKYVADNPLT
jgi:hypothetical protein